MLFSTLYDLECFFGHGHETITLREAGFSIENYVHWNGREMSTSEGLWVSQINYFFTTKHFATLLLYVIL